jgi:transcriptional regulator with XRE-family HTH domain
MSIVRHDAARAFGQALRATRLARGMSQERLAELAELDRTTPSLYERGLRTPTLTVVIEVAQALGVEPAELVSDTLERLNFRSHLIRCYRMRAREALRDAVDGDLNMYQQRRYRVPANVAG